MRWRGRRQSTNVEDQRGQRPASTGFGRTGRPLRIPLGRGVGGGGLTGIIIVVVLFFVLRAIGIDPLQLVEDGPSAPQTTQEGVAPSDEAGQFVATVLAETEDVWNGIFQASGQAYREPTLVLFGGEVRSACGFASSAAGPFYCPGDQRLYIDLDFFEELDRRFGAPGDFAQAYVVAHEVGHHVQNLLGILGRTSQMRQRMSPAASNELSVRVELQADCFAGIWAHYADRGGLLEEGDVEEALNAAQQIGDDAIQRRTQGYVVPESFSHGTSEQRARWFMTGMRSGRVADCDTFENPV